MNLNLIRAVRTPTSERYVILGADGSDSAALELHFLANDSVAGTLTLLGDEFADKVEELLEHIDEVLLPNVSLDKSNLTFTVVRGEVVGNFVTQESDQD